MPLPSIRVSTSARRRMVLTSCSMNSGWPSSTIRIALLPAQKPHEFGVDQRIGDVEHIERNAALAEHVGEAEHFERAQHVVVHAALHDDADVADVAVEHLVELVLLDEAHRGRPALLDLFLLVRIGRRRQRDAVDVAQRVLQRILEGECRPHIVPGHEPAVDVAGADAQLQHHRRVRGLRQLEALLHRPHDRRQIRPRIQSQICDFIAKAWLRSCMIEEPSP